jgi:hypothetical protein
VLGQETQIDWRELLVDQKESNARCSSIISAHAAAERTSNGDGECYPDREECRRINEEIRRRERLGISSNVMFPRRHISFR